VSALRNEKYCNTRDNKPVGVLCHYPNVGFIFYSNTSLVTGITILKDTVDSKMRFAVREIWCRKTEAAVNTLHLNMSKKTQKPLVATELHTVTN
jgi:hypothetical protein